MQYLTLENGQQLAYHHRIGQSPGVVFCGGFRSDMESTKAQALEAWCQTHDIAFTRFDYRGHGKSDGDFMEFTIGAAISDTLAILDQVTTGPVILVGSSMGGWVALQAALERKAKITGLITIAAAPDFTERLMFARMNPEQRKELEENGVLWVPNDYSTNDYPITQALIHEARSHLMLEDSIALEMPIHLFHGQEDADVPWETSLEIAKRVIGEDVTITLLKRGDHRLSSPADLMRLCNAVERIRRTED